LTSLIAAEHCVSAIASRVSAGAVNQYTSVAATVSRFPSTETGNETSVSCAASMRRATLKVPTLPNVLGVISVYVPTSGFSEPSARCVTTSVSQPCPQ
jgi:hypothetical protein